MQPTVTPACRWDPARDPFRGDQAAAVMALTEIPLFERQQLADMVRQDYGGRWVYVGRDQVDGGRLADLRHMNYGAGRVCAGAVDRSAWPAGRHERARAYTLGRWVVLLMTSCRNVALATDTLALQPTAEPTRDGLRAARGLGGPGQAASGGFGKDFAAGLGQLAGSASANGVPEPAGLWLAALAVGLAVALRRRR